MQNALNTLYKAKSSKLQNKVIPLSFFYVKQCSLPQDIIKFKIAKFEGNLHFFKRIPLNGRKVCLQSIWFFLPKTNNRNCLCQEKTNFRNSYFLAPPRVTLALLFLTHRSFWIVTMGQSQHIIVVQDRGVQETKISDNHVFLKLSNSFSPKSEITMISSNIRLL